MTERDRFEQRLLAFAEVEARLVERGLLLPPEVKR